jgi:hypothetical protein
MKQKDIALILVMVFIGGILALVVSKMVFSSQSSREQTAEAVDSITADFPQPPSKYFNGDSVNPTQTIEIGGPTNPNPFNNKPQ